MTEVLPDLDTLFHACVTDPPYNLASIVKRFGGLNAAPAKCDGAFGRASAQFIGQEWDGEIAFDAETWRVVFDALAPGGHLVAFGGSRSFHRIAVAIEDAGFELRDVLFWLYGTGLPKSHPVDKHLVRLDADPETVAAWAGWGTALKPAYEPIILARKPVGEKSIARQVVATGTGAINIDACRQGVAQRHPANILHDGSPEVLELLGDSAKFFPSFPFSEDDHKRGHYSAKANKTDRRGSLHPTVKPQSLMRWLCRLVCPPGGRIVDPFAGSGATGWAATAEGFDPTLIELTEEHAAHLVRAAMIEEFAG